MNLMETEHITTIMEMSIGVNGKMGKSMAKEYLLGNQAIYTKNLNSWKALPLIYDFLEIRGVEPPLHQMVCAKDVADKVFPSCLYAFRLISWSNVSLIDLKARKVASVSLL